MAGVTFKLGADALRNWSSWIISLVALAILLRWKMSAAWVVLGGGIAGLLLMTMHGR
jgi:chromate transporter